MQTNLGHAVGYKIRFGDHVTDHTYIKLMTDGIACWPRFRATGC